MSAPHGELLHIDERRGRELRAQRLDADRAARVSARLRALGDPTRLGLALALRDGRELCVCDLSWICERPQGLVSHHMKTLRGERIVSARKEGKMTMYRLTSEGQHLLETALSEGGL